MQLVAWAVKAQILDPVSAVEMLPFHNKDIIIERLKERQAAQQAQLAKLEKEDPEAYAKVIRGSGHRHAA